ncbi:MAG: metallophosphoesterase [Lachnospiraceae bacterium]|nr:metallophosphoesterase [Lachnospiraceae bacterium]
MGTIMDKVILEGTKEESQEINILHISDLHFGVGDSTSKKELYQHQRKEMIDCLISQLCAYQNRVGYWKPDVVVVSGDLAFKGATREYDQYKKDFYEAIKKGFNIDEDCIVVCPGNHDIIRKNTIVGTIANGKGMLYPRPQNAGISIGDELESLRKFDEGKVCREQIGTNINKPRAKHFHDYIVKCCDGDPQKLVRLQIPNKWPWVHFIALNSAWDCRDDEDEGKLRVGLDFLNEALMQSKEKGPEDSIICAVFHHPHMTIDIDDGHGGRKKCNWLAPSEQYPINKGEDYFVSRINNSAKCIMNGHVHEKKTPIYLGNDMQMGFWSICGTLLSNDTSTYHCRVIKIRRGGSLSYIDLSNTAGNTSGDWEISFHPGNRVDRELLNQEAAIQVKKEITQIVSSELLLNSKEKFEVISQLVSRIISLAINNSEFNSDLFEYFIKEYLEHENNEVYTLRHTIKE